MVKTTIELSEDFVAKKMPIVTVTKEKKQVTKVYFFQFAYCMHMAALCVASFTASPVQWVISLLKRQANATEQHTSTAIHITFQNNIS